MPSLKITIAQLPVLTDPVFSVKGRIVVVGTVSVTTSKPLTIGGLKLVWATTLSKRILDEKHPDKVKWGRASVLDTSETMVLDTEQVIPAGTNQYEFVIDIPSETLDTRTTHYDKIRHHLSAGLLAASPCYDEIYGCMTPTTSYDTPRRPSAGTLFKALRQAAKASTPKTRFSGYSSEEEGEFSGIPVLAASSINVPVYRTSCAIENDPSYRYAYQGKIAGLEANFEYSLNSANFALGGLVDVDIALKDIPYDATVHAIQLTMRQTTESPPVGDCDKTDSAIDEYTLWDQGSASLIFSGRPRPTADSYIWRGSGARQLDNLPQGTMLNLPFPRLRQTIHLPSPIIGAVSSHNIATTLTDAPSRIATVSHTINLEILYSVLGQGSNGTILPPGSDRRPVEGILRSWKLEKEVVIANDTRISGQTAPPGYSSSSDTSQSIPTEQTPIMLCALLPWKTSFGNGTRRWLRHVSLDEKTLRKRIWNHFEDTEGFCECFTQRERDQPRDWSGDCVEERIDHRCKV